MHLAQRKTVTAVALTVVLVLCASTIRTQQPSSTLRGRIVDELGSLIVGARVTIKNASGVEQSSTTDATGSFQIFGLEPGRYIVQASALGLLFMRNLTWKLLSDSLYSLILR